jgi:hypothetical protein
MCKWIYAAIAVLLFTGCAGHTRTAPANVSFGVQRTLATPVSAANEAAPRIIAIHFSGNDVRRPGKWSGKIITTTNVASVEVRTNLFSIDVPRRRFGEFAFELRLLDVPPIFIRAYTLRVIARNSAGTAIEEDLPMRIR